MRPFRFGVLTRVAHSREEWLGKARRAEALGYATFLVPDHFRDQVATSVGIMAAAAATTTIRVGSMVYDNDFRHPAVIAKDAATLDLLSGGRFELGLGAGWLLPDYSQTGISFDPGQVRVERLEEAVRIITRYLEGGPVTFKGKHYAVTELEGLPRPVQRPRPPLLIGGGGPKILALAARAADIVGIVPRTHADGSGLDTTDTSPAALDTKVATIRAAAGARFDRLELNVLVQRALVADDPGPALAEVAQQWRLEPAQARESPFVLAGSVDGIADALEARRARYGISYVTIFEQFMDDFAPVVTRLAGR
ncbi:MAG TPA: TIGR03621 family F420-dependent LLM class oxidoreductase [Methylomirabilota bacterium]|nr:TIGR03621 family F420-dependent LLM class oxidoreductase [Methylomirabilota bacterium]